MSSKLQANANVTFLKGRISFCMDHFEKVTGKTDTQAIAGEPPRDCWSEEKIGWYSDRQHIAVQIFPDIILTNQFKMCECVVFGCTCATLSALVCVLGA